MRTWVLSTRTNRSRRAVAWMLCVTGTLALSACTNDTKQPPVAGNSATEAGHEHAGHDHGDEHAGHEHGPHEGEMIELAGGKFHAELLHDHDTHTTTIYLLGEDAKTAAPIDAKELTMNVVVDGKPTQFSLPADAEASDPDGKSSKFELSDEGLCSALDTEGAKARLNAQIDGQAVTGDVPEHGHDHEGHRH